MKETILLMMMIVLTSYQVSADEMPGNASVETSLFKSNIEDCDWYSYEGVEAAPIFCLIEDGEGKGVLIQGEQDILPLEQKSQDDNGTIYSLTGEGQELVVGTDGSLTIQDANGEQIANVIKVVNEDMVEETVVEEAVAEETAVEEETVPSITSADRATDKSTSTTVEQSNCKLHGNCHLVYREVITKEVYECHGVECGTKTGCCNGGYNNGCRSNCGTKVYTNGCRNRGNCRRPFDDHHVRNIGRGIENGLRGIGRGIKRAQENARARRAQRRAARAEQERQWREEQEKRVIDSKEYHDTLGL